MTYKSSQFDKTVISFWQYIIINILFSTMYGILGGHLSFELLAFRVNFDKEGNIFEKLGLLKITLHRSVYL